MTGFHRGLSGDQGMGPKGVLLWDPCLSFWLTRNRDHGSYLLVVLLGIPAVNGILLRWPESCLTLPTVCITISRRSLQGLRPRTSVRTKEP